MSQANILPARMKWDVETFSSLATNEAFFEKRLELLDGDILEMAPIGARHMDLVARLTYLMGRAASDQHTVSVQNGIRLNAKTELYPDVAILRQSPDTPIRELPTPAEVLLIIEVSDSTLKYDRKVKTPRYLEAGIPEVWIVNATNFSVEIQRLNESAQIMKHGTIFLATTPKIRIDIDALFIKR